MIMKSNIYAKTISRKKKLKPTVSDIKIKTVQKLIKQMVEKLMKSQSLHSCVKS